MDLYDRTDASRLSNSVSMEQTLTAPLNTTADFFVITIMN